MGLGHLIDRAVGVLSPGAALRRQSARLALAELATYAGADRGRRNKDWRATGQSADAAIIPDAKTLNARARQLLRDSWIAQSVQYAKTRNVVGRGITPIPVAVDEAGGEMDAFNKAAERLFHGWADCPDHCDLEGRQTFWQKQALAVDEKTAVGEHFLVWSYLGAGGPNVGLRLQSFEPEQLDDTIRDFGGNEVRGGVEVDANGKAEAYHFWLRNPADYHPRRSLRSVRVPRERVKHYYRPRRVLQTRGVTELAPVLQKVRDAHRRDDAELMAAVMEACLGMAITRTQPTVGTNVPGVARRSGDSGQTQGGLRTFDMVPGMVAELQPGEDVKFLTPQRYGAGYEAAMAVNLRGIGAGVDTSYEQVARDFSKGTYSAQRQAMLEDWRGWRVEQDLITDLVVCPVYELFVHFAVLEGRLPVTIEQYRADPRRWKEAEYVPDGHEWIDPKAEAEAVKTALELKLTNRKIEVGRRGGRYLKVLDQYAAEVKQATERGVSLPDAAADPKAAGGPPGGRPGGGPGTPPGAGPTPAAGGLPDPNAVEAVTEAAPPSLNGAQITAAIDVVSRVSKGEIPPFAGEQFLAGVGIPAATAKQMIQEATAGKAAPPPGPPAAP